MLEDYINERIGEAYDLMQNDSEKALEILEDLLEIEPENTKAINGKGSTLMKLGRFDEADECFSQSLVISKTSSALINRAMIFKHKNDFENAMKYYDEALKVNPDLENIITILKGEMANVHEDTDLDSSYYRANKLIEKGCELKNDNMLWDAMEAFSKAVEEDSSFENQARELSDEIRVILEKEFVYEDADFDITVKTDRIRAKAIKAYRKENDPKKALALIDIVLKQDKNDMNMLNRKGGVLFICSKHQNAIECFDECLRIDSSYSCVLFNKAIVLRAENNLSEALECFDELSKMPDYQKKAEPYRLETASKLEMEK